MKAFFKYLPAAIMLLGACRHQPEVPIRIDRMEHALFSIPVDSIADAVPQLRERYAELLDIYSEGVIAIGRTDVPQYVQMLKHFLTDEYMNMAFERVMEIYPDLKELESDLGKAFYNYRKEFPDRVIPHIYTLTSGFNQSMITADTILAIALDKYLGREEDMYYRLEIPTYLRHAMDRKYVATDCVKAWLYTEFPYNDSIDTVLDNIVYEGKIMYALHRLTPETPDSIMLGYTPVQMAWCYENTALMWTFLVEKKMLYMKDDLTLSKLISPAPFSSFFGHESPGRAVAWLGYRIVSAYMKHNRVSLEAMLLNNDSGELLNKARFKP